MTAINRVLPFLSSRQPGPTSRRTWLVTILVSFLLTTLCATGIASSSIPSLKDADWGRSRYARMHMLLEKTILMIDIVNIEVRVDPSTEREFERLSRAQPNVQAIEQDLAKAMFEAPQALVELTFLREITLEQFMGGVRESLDEAQRAGAISETLRKQVSAGLPESFKAMKDSGFQKGDRVLYKVNATQLRTVVVRADGQVAIDRTDHGADKRMILLGCYFAKETSYRQPLLSSLGK